MRARVIAEGFPLVQDVVVTAPNRDDVGVLVFARIDDCRRVTGLGAEAGVPELLQHPAVREFFQALADKLWQQGTGSATRVARLHLLAEPPSIDQGEITDKGSINQRAVLTQRAAIVDALYDPADSQLDIIVPGR